MLNAYDLNLRHLNAVRAIGREGGISRAAAAVFLSQPAITQALGKLERVLGLSLFDRHAGGMTPTAAGALLIARADRAAGYLAEGARALKAPSLERLVGMVHLRALIAVVAHGGFAPAARATGLSEPALHRAVRDFERLSGAVLLARVGRTVRATPGAERFVRGARLALAEIEAGLGELAALRGKGGERVAIGAMPLARAWLAPKAIALTHEAAPNLRFALVEGPYAELLSQLRSGELDLLIGALRLPPPADDVVEETLFIDQAVIAARPDHPLARVAAPDIESLRAYPWAIAREGTPLREAWISMFESGGVAPPPVGLECGSVMAINALLREGDWLTLLSPEQIRRERDAGWLTTLGAPVAGARRPIGLTLRRDWMASPGQRHFVETLRRLAVETFQN